MKLNGPANVEEDLLALETAPDRAWRKVLLHNRKHKEPGRDPANAFLREGCRFARRWEKAGAEDYDALAKAFPTLLPAYLFYQGTDPRKWLIEAALLTRDRDRSFLTADMGLDAAVFTRYAKMFFDVEGKLDSQAYIAMNVLGPTTIGGISEKDHDFLLKTLAYFYGWEVVLQFIGQGRLSSDAAAKLRSGLNDKTLKNAWQAAHALRINNYNAVDVQNIYWQIEAIEREKGAEAGENAAMKLVKGLMDSCKMTVMRSDTVLPADEPRALSNDGSFLIRMKPEPVKRLVESEK